LYDFEFVSVVKTNPELAYPKVGTIYKTILIRNTGISDFPKGAYLYNKNNLNYKIQLPAVAIKSDYSVTVEIKS